jgi:hypothetical protein
MICELVGAADLSARPDPQDMRQVIAAYHRMVGEIIAGFDGVVGESAMLSARARPRIERLSARRRISPAG